MPHFAYDVFLSFASLNESMARTLYNQLCRSGLKVFWSDEALKKKVGTSWSKVIEESIVTSRHMVVLWTREAEASDWVEEEWRTFHAESMGKTDRLLVPVLVNGKEAQSLPTFLRRRQSHHLNGELGQLITSLGGHFIPLEQENARLKQELEEAKAEITLLKKSRGTANKAEVQRVQNELDTLMRQYAELENKHKKQSNELSMLAEERDGLLESDTRLTALQKEYDNLKKKHQTLESRSKKLSEEIKKKDAQLRNQEEAHQKALAALEKEPAPQKPKRKPLVKSPAKTLTDDHGIEFVLIEPGTFMMGDKKWSHTRPVHNVEITRPYYLGTYPVTQSQWKALMRNEPSYFKGLKNPVENVSWNDVQEFLKKLNSGESTYQLPTSAEWEYACRAGTTTAYSFGDDEKQLDDYVWYLSNSGNSTHPVGDKQANPWGLYDMHGNVWEWVQDWYAGSYYEQFQNQTTIEPMGPDKGAVRVVRGGDWDSFARYLRSGNRSYRPPGYGSNLIGFRLLRTLP